MTRSISLLLFACLFFSFAHAQDYRRGDILLTTHPKTILFAEPTDAMRTNSAIPAGRRVKAAGSPENGFVPLVTKSGRAWVHTRDVKPDAPVLEDPGEETRPSPTRFPFGIQRMTFDLGGSIGHSGELRYTEINLGLNSYFSDYLAWRNAVFGRFIETLGNTYGLDTSVRGIYGISQGSAGFTIFAGPGYRFATGDGSAPLAEAGLVLRLAGISIGGGVKTLFNSFVRSGAANDTQYFLILAGGGSL